MARLSRENILNIEDIVTEEIEIEEWGGSILVKALNGLERAKVIDACMNPKGKYSTTKLYPSLIVAGCVEPKFSPDDADKLNEKNAGVLEKIAQVIMKLSGISSEDVEDEEKN